MARGERIAMVTVALLLFGLSALVNGADAAENLFPVFPTYPVDGNMEDEARYGVISLTGATSNSTLNLSGIVLLGMSLSAAVCIWAYTHNLLDKTPDDRSQHLLSNQFKRSLNDDGTESLSVMLSNMHRSFERAEVYEPTCRQRIMCEIGAGQKMPATYPENSFGHSVNSFFGSTDGKKALIERLENHKRAKTYLMAWNEGKGGKVCKAAYDQCSMTKDSIDKFIESSEFKKQ